MTAFYSLTDMEDNSLTLTIELHYHLDKEEYHQMDAIIHNKCEANILEAINNLAEIFDEDISLDVSALGEGGIIDRLKISVNSSTAKDVILILVGALANHFISPSVSLDDTQKMLNRADVIRRIKEGNYTDDELEFVILGDPKLLSAKSRYYKELDKEPHVTRVSCSTYGEHCPPKAMVNSSIDKRDFIKQVLINTPTSIVQDYTATTVIVISPVLSKESKAKWRGIFNGDTVSFRIKDKDFLEQVYNKEVGFTTGTSLKCDVRVSVVTKYDNNGDEVSVSNDMVVLNVISWYDDENFQCETKRYKRKKNAATQLSLFTEEDF